MKFAICLNKKVEANYLIKSIDSLIAKYAKENNGLEGCVLVLDIVKISDPPATLVGGSSD